MDFRIYLPVQQGLFDKHVHGVEQQVGLGSVCSQGVDHDALDQARLPQRLHEIYELLGEPERHELRHGEELRGRRGNFIEGLFVDQKKNYLCDFVNNIRLPGYFSYGIKGVFLKKKKKNPGPEKTIRQGLRLTCVAEPKA